MKVNLIKHAIIMILIYILPMMVLFKMEYSKVRRKTFLILFSVVYLIIGNFTQNLLPFLIVIFCIKNMKFNEEFYYDYYQYKFNFSNFKITKALKYAFISYVISILVTGITYMIFNKYNISIKQQEIVSYMDSMPIGMFIIVIPVTMIFAPIVEEYIFRWLLCEKLIKNYLGIIMASIVTSLIFGVVHFNLKAFTAIFFMGIFNCFLIHKKGYWYAVFNHCIFNSVSIIILLLQKLNIN